MLIGAVDCDEMLAERPRIERGIEEETCYLGYDAPSMGGSRSRPGRTSFLLGAAVESNEVGERDIAASASDARAFEFAGLDQACESPS